MPSETATRRRTSGDAAWGNSFWPEDSEGDVSSATSRSGVGSYAYSAQSYSTSSYRDGESTLMEESSAFDASTLNDGSTFMDGGSTVLDGDTYFEDDASSDGSSELGLKERLKSSKKEAPTGSKTSAFSRIVSALSDVDRNLGSMLRPGSRLRTPQRTTSLNSHGVEYDGASSEKSELVKISSQTSSAKHDGDLFSNGRQSKNTAATKNKPYVAAAASFDSEEKKEPDLFVRKERFETSKRKKETVKPAISTDEEGSYYTTDHEDNTYYTRMLEDDTIFTKDQEDDTIFTRDQEVETVFTREDDTLFTRDQGTLVTDYGFDDDLSGGPASVISRSYEKQTDRVIDDFGGFFSCFSQFPSFSAAKNETVSLGENDEGSQHGSEASYSIGTYEENTARSTKYEGNHSVSQGESKQQSKRTAQKSTRGGLSSLKERYGFRKLYYTTEESSVDSNMDQSHIYLMMTNARRKRNGDKASSVATKQELSVHEGTQERGTRRHKTKKAAESSIESFNDKNDETSGRPGAIVFGNNSSVRPSVRGNRSNTNKRNPAKPSTAELLGAAYVMEKWLHEAKEAIRRSKDSSGFTLSPIVQKRRIAAKASLTKLAQQAAARKQRYPSRR